MREGWSEARIDELGNGSRPVLKAGPFGSSVTKATYQASGYKVYGQQEVVAKDLNAEAYFVSEGTFRRHKGCEVKPGDLLMTMMGTIGRVYRVPEGAPKGIINPRLVRIAFDASRILVEFAEAALEQPPLQRLLDRRSHGGTMQGLNLDALASIRLQLPPLPEQRKIAAILGTWGEALDKLAALRASRSERFAGLTQKLLGRGGVFPDKWPLNPLSSIATRVRRQNGGGDHPVMTISARSGFLMQSDKFARDMAGSSVDRYTLLHEGEFAYNKGNSLVAPYGCIYRLDRPSALVPFVYFCFALKPGLDHAFYEHLFAAGALNHQLSRLINSGVRNDGLLNLNIEDFFGCRIPVPPVDEQRRIALTLSAAKDELALLDQEIEALTRQKRGLMQKLLTGEWHAAADAKAATEAAE
ncbi:restriction endonuclease subunit S [Rhizobium leguminosarum]|uniref:restriction endonuclease subunit S n=1 Tax=Rhizobium TaxID=379 RepID=UPI00140FAB4B|nr:restriction endonuclease subunit S [Rhizobium leguminosarum]QIO66057.1 restriction endonuclease subunit S [Rhizobium leguminosarum bv. trifolii]